MSQPSPGVLIAIDWENIRRGAQLCQAMHDVGRIFGEVGGGKAFGDWSLRPDDGREFAEHDVTPYHAPRTSADKDRTASAILLEVYEWIRDRDDCATVILGSGGADYQVLVDRAKSYGKRIVLCAFSASVSRDMLATARLFPLDAELGIQLGEHGDVDVRPKAEPEENEGDGDDVLAPVRAADVRPGEADELRGLQHVVQPVDAGLGGGLERARMPATGRRVRGRWDRGAPRRVQPQQSRLADVGGAVGEERRASAPGAGVQRRAGTEPGAHAFVMGRVRYFSANGDGWFRTTRSAPAAWRGAVNLRRCSSNALGGRIDAPICSFQRSMVLS